MSTTSSSNFVLVEFRSNLAKRDTSRRPSALKQIITLLRSPDPLLMLHAAMLDASDGPIPSLTDYGDIQRKHNVLFICDCFTQILRDLSGAESITLQSFFLGGGVLDMSTVFMMSPTLFDRKVVDQVGLSFEYCT